MIRFFFVCVLLCLSHSYAMENMEDLDHLFEDLDKLSDTPSAPDILAPLDNYLTLELVSSPTLLTFPTTPLEKEHLDFVVTLVKKRKPKKHDTDEYIPSEPEEYIASGSTYPVKRRAYSSKISTHNYQCSSQSRHVCPECFRSFKKSTFLDLHYARNHQDETPHECKHCDKAYSTNDSLRLHTIRNHIPKTFQCPKCLKWYATRGDLNSHNKQHLK